MAYTSNLPMLETLLCQLDYITMLDWQSDQLMIKKIGTDAMLRLNRDRIEQIPPSILVNDINMEFDSYEKSKDSYMHPLFISNKQLKDERIRRAFEELKILIKLIGD